MAEDAPRLGLKRQERRSFAGIPIVIEYRKGDIRNGKSPEGYVWSRKMKSAYGRVVNTKGVDKDPIDVYVGENPNSMAVYVVDQMKKPDFKEIDEQKFMLGYDSLDQAKGAYLENYPDNRILGKIKSMPLTKFMDYVNGKDGADPTKLAVRMPKMKPLPRRVQGLRRATPEIMRDAIRDAPREAARNRYTYTVDRVVKPSKEPEKTAMSKDLSQYIEINMARLSEGKSLEKLAKRTAKQEGDILASRFVGGMAGIPIGTGVGMLAARGNKSSLKPFVGMAMGQLVGQLAGDQFAKRTMKKSSSGAVEILRERIKAAGAAGAFHKAMSDPLLKTRNIAKAGVLGVGALGLYTGYKGVKAVSNLAKEPRGSLPQPGYLGTGRPFR